MRPTRSASSKTSAAPSRIRIRRRPPPEILLGLEKDLPRHEAGPGTKGRTGQRLEPISRVTRPRQGEQLDAPAAALPPGQDAARE